MNDEDVRPWPGMTTEPRECPTCGGLLEMRADARGLCFYVCNNDHRFSLPEVLTPGGEAVEHDYTVRTWGHDFTIPTVNRRGEWLDITGWGSGIKTGDYLILPLTASTGEQSTTRYKVDRIHYYDDPPDQWHAEVSFSPRKTQ